MGDGDFVDEIEKFGANDTREVILVSYLG